MPAPKPIISKRAGPDRTNPFIGSEGIYSAILIGQFFVEEFFNDEWEEQAFYLIGELSTVKTWASKPRM